MTLNRKGDFHKEIAQTEFCSRKPPQIRTFSVPLWVGLNTPCTDDRTVFFLGETCPDLMRWEFPTSPAEELPIQRMLRQAAEWQKLIDGGEANKADIARMNECSRPRVTQIMSLLDLSQEVRELILSLGSIEVGECGVTERGLRPLVRLSPAEQLEAVQGMVEQAQAGADLRVQRFRRGKGSGRLE